MYRFLLRPSWVLLHVTVVATIVLMINLGIWQFDRYHERMDFNEIVSARIEAQPQNLNELLLEIETGTKTAKDAEWLNIITSGEYLDQQTVNAVNRSQGGFSGVDQLFNERGFGRGGLRKQHLGIGFFDPAGLYERSCKTAERRLLRDGCHECF